jgi:hypothetical protein
MRHLLSDTADIFLPGRLKDVSFLCADWSKKFGEKRPIWVENLQKLKKKQFLVQKFRLLHQKKWVMTISQTIFAHQNTIIILANFTSHFSRL